MKAPIAVLYLLSCDPWFAEHYKWGFWFHQPHTSLVCHALQVTREMLLVSRHSETCPLLYRQLWGIVDCPEPRIVSTSIITLLLEAPRFWKHLLNAILLLSTEGHYWQSVPDYLAKSVGYGPTFAISSLVIIPCYLARHPLSDSKGIGVVIMTQACLTYILHPRASLYTAPMRWDSASIVQPEAMEFWSIYVQVLYR